MPQGTFCERGDVKVLRPQHPFRVNPKQLGLQPDPCNRPNSNTYQRSKVLATRQCERVVGRVWPQSGSSTGLRPPALRLVGDNVLLPCSLFGPLCTLHQHKVQVWSLGKVDSYLQLPRPRHAQCGRSPRSRSFPPAGLQDTQQ